MKVIDNEPPAPTDAELGQIEAFLRPLSGPLDAERRWLAAPR